MPRLARLAAIVCLASLVTTGGIAGIVAIGHEAFTHAATALAAPLAPLSATVEQASTVYADDGTTVLATFRGAATRKPIGLSEMAPVLIKAVLDTEDARFYIHGGFDIPSTLRALASNSSSSGGIQGGSTITQQLVKQTYLTSQRKLSRKIKEAVLADRLQRKYSKDQILDAYLNTIYLGNGAYGVEAAANAYFGEHASQVTLPQAALLAGLIQNPSGDDPIRNPQDARTRRSQVIARMLHYHHITQAQADAANSTALPISVHHPRSSVDTIEDYYVRQVENQLLDQPNSPLGSSYTERYNALFEGGLKIYTNLDPRLQALATQTVAADTPANSRGFKQAMVVIDPSTGNVRAMVGGSGFNNSQYDVVTDGTRQPGSGFKLMTLLAALAAGYSPFDTLDAHAPCAINFPGDSYYVTHPANNDEGPGSGGVMTIVQATAQSMNCGYLRLAHEVGLPAIINMANSVGITTLLNPFPSMVLGAEAVHPIDLAAAYAAVADNGVYHPPTFIDHVVDGTGQTIYRGESPGHRVFSQQVASEATLCLQAVVTSGTGYAAGLPGRPVAGKTGTTTKSVDAWFNGFTPQLETTVWMGSPTFEIPMYGVGGVYEVYGGTFPAHTWHNFMEQALAPEPVLYFVPLDPYLLPATKYITSPSLVRDDHSDHNFYVPPTTTTTSTTQPSQTPTTTANSGPTPSTPPGSSPPTTAGGDGHGHGGN